MKPSDVYHWCCESSYASLMNLDDFESFLADAIIAAKCLLCYEPARRIAVDGLCPRCRQDVSEELLKKVRGDYYVQLTVKRKDGTTIQHEFVK